LTENELEADRNRRGPAGRETIVSGRRSKEVSKKRNTAKKSGDNCNSLHGCGRSYVAPGKKCDETVVVRRACVVMKQFMERGTGGEGAITEQQDYQETSERRFRNKAGNRFLSFQLQIGMQSTKSAAWAQAIF
jgi:hypothetical protein